MRGAGAGERRGRARAGAAGAEGATGFVAGDSASGEMMENVFLRPPRPPPLFVFVNSALERVMSKPESNTYV